MNLQFKKNIHLNKNIIIFRTDQLGDFIIISKIIFHLKKKYPNSNITVVCSTYNSKIIKYYNFIDNVIVYNKSYSIKKKIKIFKKICAKKYLISLLDGQKFSYFVNCFIKSKFKLCIKNKYIKKLLGFTISLYKPSIFYNFFFTNRSVSFNSRKSKILEKPLINKYLELFSIFNLKIKKPYKYIFPEQKKIINQYYILKKKLNLNNFLIINFDEKWNDIIDIENKLLHEIIKFQKKNNLIILLTSYNNNSLYFKNLSNKFKIIYNKSKLFKNIKMLNNKIYILENLNIFLFAQFLSNSLYNISCHSGFVAQLAGSNNSKIIDIINNEDIFWYKSWIPRNIFHRFVFKSKNKKNIPLNTIFDKINKIITNK